MKKFLVVLATLVAVVALVTGSIVTYTAIRDHAIPIAITHPKPTRYVDSWSSSCKLRFTWNAWGTQQYGAYPGGTYDGTSVEPDSATGTSFVAVGVPVPTIFVAVANSGTKIQEFSNYSGFVWADGMIIGHFTGSFGGTTYASVGEQWSTQTDIAAVPNVYPGEPWGQETNDGSTKPNARVVGWPPMQPGQDVGIPIWGVPYSTVAGVYNTAALGTWTDGDGGTYTVPFALYTKSSDYKSWYPGESQKPWVNPWNENTTGDPVTCTIQGVS
jgi:hypothetical protein